MGGGWMELQFARGGGKQHKQENRCNRLFENSGNKQLQSNETFWGEHKQTSYTAAIDQQTELILAWKDQGKQQKAVYYSRSTGDKQTNLNLKTFHKQNHVWSHMWKVNLDKFIETNKANKSLESVRFWLGFRLGLHISKNDLFLTTLWMLPRKCDFKQYKWSRRGVMAISGEILNLDVLHMQIRLAMDDHCQIFTAKKSEHRWQLWFGSSLSLVHNFLHQYWFLQVSFIDVILKPSHTLPWQFSDFMNISQTI